MSEPQSASVSRASAQADSARASVQARSGTGDVGSLATLAWMHFLEDGASMFLPGVLPAVMVALHIKLALVGTVMAALVLGQFFQPVWGWAADRMGGRMFVLVGTCATAIAGGLVGLVPGYLSLIVVLALIGTGAACFHPQALASVTQISGVRQGLFMSVFLVGGELGRGLWPLLASVIVQHLGLRALWFLALPAVISVPILGARVPKLKPRHQQSVPVHHTSWRRRRLQLTSLLSFTILRSVVVMSLSTFVPVMLAARGSSLVAAASAISIFLTVGIIGNLSGGYIADRFGRRVVLGGATALTTGFLALFLLLGGAAVWVMMGLLGISLFSTFPLAILIIQDILPDRRSLGSGLALGFSGGIAAIVVAGLGFIAARFSIEAVLWLNVALCAVSLLCIPVLPEQRMEPEAAGPA